MSLCIVHPFTPPEHCGITSLTLPQHYQPVCWARAAVSHKVHLCQYKQEVAKAVFPWKFSGGIARLTPGIPSHWGNNWHSWDREKQTSPNMFWWSLPVRWCLWRAAEQNKSIQRHLQDSPYPCFEARVQSERSLIVLFLLATSWKMLEDLLA